MRQLKSKGAPEDSRPSLNQLPAATSPVLPPAKRRCISSACRPCRKRKSKCDGGKPRCSTCTAVYRTDCFYDTEAEVTAKASVKPEPTGSSEQPNALETIIAALRSSTDAEAAEIVQHIRAEEEDLENLAEIIRKRNIALPARSDAKGAEGDLANLIGKQSHHGGIVKHYGSTSSLGLVLNSEEPPVQVGFSGSWTNVTKDQSLIKQLVDLYFSWSHSFWVVFPKHLFLHDMKYGRTQHCSSILVNAVLAFGCLYSDRPEARTNPADPRTAGDHFFAEAKRLLELEGPCVTTVQALAIMAMREPCHDRDSSGNSFMGRCIHMGVELGLHLNLGSDSKNLSDTEAEARKLTWWGCWTLENAFSTCIGRIAQLPRAAINVDRPRIDPQIEQQMWKPYETFGPITGTRGQAENSCTLVTQNSLLAEIVNDTLTMFYAPRERFTSRKLLDFHNRYKRWHSRLPEELLLKESSAPHVYILHMYYHTSVMHLFRPFLKVDITNSAVSPLEEVRSCANTIHNMVSDFRRIYSFERGLLILSHVIMSANIIDLVMMPDPTAVQHLILGATCLREMGYNQVLSSRFLNIVLALAKQWNKKLPPDVYQAAYGPGPWPDGAKPLEIEQTQGPTPGSEPSRRASEATDVEGSLNGSNDAIHKDASRNQNNGDAYYWTPFPHQSVPMRGVQPSGPMDISNVIDDEYNDQWLLNRDGFKISGLGDPTNSSNQYALEAQWRLTAS